MFDDDAAVETSDFEVAVNQLAAAADLLAAGVPIDEHMSAHRMRAFFRLQQGRSSEPDIWRTADDEFFKSTALPRSP
ncbi:hypothetical protein [Paraburkholderia sp. HD33-4]|uniref:hypothetical protein n=1 Tax=Paraburkholderia sp. HD33-4 TaxID=2883242 RepID=UPI001F328790|nr:hypothetical protein [Paraburkholderia sp. HD33-4]